MRWALNGVCSLAGKSCKHIEKHGKRWAGVVLVELESRKCFFLKVSDEKEHVWVCMFRNICLSKVSNRKISQEVSQKNRSHRQRRVSKSKVSPGQRRDQMARSHRRSHKKETSHTKQSLRSLMERKGLTKGKGLSLRTKMGLTWLSQEVALNHSHPAYYVFCWLLLMFFFWRLSKLLLCFPASCSFRPQATTVLYRLVLLSSPR